MQTAFDLACIKSSIFSAEKLRLLSVNHAGTDEKSDVRHSFCYFDCAGQNFVGFWVDFLTKASVNCDV